MSATLRTQAKRKSKGSSKDGNPSDDAIGPSNRRPCGHVQQAAAPTPAPGGIQYFRHFVRRLSMLGFVAVVIYYMSMRDPYVALAKAGETVSRIALQVPCSEDHVAESHKWKECSPKRCGRVVMDNVITASDVEKLLSIAKKGLAFGGSSGGASILDLHSGALSKGESFINIYTLNESRNIFSEEDFAVYRRVKNSIQLRIGMEFGVLPQNMFLTHPTFFSWINSKPAKIVHDEYWHPHVDKETYESFHYTSLLYLGTHNEDFTGGRFIFVDKDSNKSVEPRKGRLSMFTSGSENLHHVEKVTSGERYAITVSFTCDKRFAIADPVKSKFSIGT